MEKSSKQVRKWRGPVPQRSRIPSRQRPSSGQDRFSVRSGRFLATGAEKLGGWTYDFVRHHWLGIVNFHLLAFVAGALEAPLLLHLDQQWISRLVYGFYGLFCHQEPSRCLALFGSQMAICSRCLSFYSSLLLFGVLLSLRKMRPLSLKLALILIFPAAADILLQSIHLTESTNLTRLTSGMLLGMGVSLYLFPRAQRSVDRLNRG